MPATKVRNEQAEQVIAAWEAKKKDWQEAEAASLAAGEKANKGGSKAKAKACNTSGGDGEDDDLFVRCAKTSEYFHVKIVKHNEVSVKVHYAGYNKRCDEWVRRWALKHTTLHAIGPSGWCCT